MPLLGNPLVKAFSSIPKQTITGDGTVGPYTLDYPAGSDQDVEVYVNNVRQEPGVAYTVAGTAMTMTGAVQSSDDFYVIFQGSAQQTVTPAAGSVIDSMIVDMSSSKLTGALPAVDGSALTGLAVANRNLIINGAMTVAQRGTSFTSAANAAYTLDRFVWYDTGAGVVDISQATDTPNGNFKNSLKIDVTTADSSLAAGDLYAIIHNIEGTVSSQLGWGTSDAKNVTVSFWIKSPKTGTHSVAVQNSAQNRSRSEEFTVSAADTWEYKSVSFIGDTSGTWLTTNGVGVRIAFPLASGSTFTQAAGSWGTGNIYASTNQVNCMDDAANNFFITGIQFEVGDTATPFEHRSYGDELAKCQRYFIKNSATAWQFTVTSLGSTFGRSSWDFPTTMRAAPTVSNITFNNSNYTASGSQFFTVDGFTVYTNGHTGTVQCTGWEADAEL